MPLVLTQEIYDARSEWLHTTERALDLLLLWDNHYLKPNPVPGLEDLLDTQQDLIDGPFPTAHVAIGYQQQTEELNNACKILEYYLRNKH